MKQLGRHVLIEFYECSHVALNNPEFIEGVLLTAARVAGATIVGKIFHHYNPHGVTGVVVIAESHFSIHTWPEYGYAAVDLFTCGDVDPWKAFTYLEQALSARRSSQTEIRRGLFPQDVCHKPCANG